MADETLDFDALIKLAHESASVVGACACAIDGYREWTRVPAEFPTNLMRTVGSLRDDPYVEPTFAEYHRAGTGYWSADAPIAPRYYPFNRCTVQQCGHCGRACLTYVEAGGYYVEPRIRALNPALLVNVPLVD